MVAHALARFREARSRSAAVTGSRTASCVVLSLLALAVAPPARAQSGAPAAPEDIEPRIVGTTGTMLIGLAGYVDRFSSAERRLPTNYAAQVDVGRFIARRLVVSGGLAGTGSFGGDDADGLAAGSGAPAFHAFTGLFYYFTPRSMVSLYSGGEYWAQLTRRAEADAGSLVGKIGVHGVLSSRAGLFLEGGYGIALTRGEDDDVMSRVVGRVGVRLKF